MNRLILRALIIKETLQIIRDPSTMLIAFVLPLILLFIFGYGVNLDTNRIRLGVVLEQEDPTTLSLMQAFQYSPYMEVDIARNRHAFEHKLVSGKLRSMVVIPDYFTARQLSETSVVPLQVLTDGSEPQIASFAQNYARGVLQNWLRYEAYMQGSLNERSITLKPRYWYNQELKSRNFLIPGSIVIVMTLIGTLLTSLVIAREWERGTMEAMMATPISIIEILLGKLLPYFILGMGSMFLCTFIATIYYGVPFRGSMLLLILLSSVFLLTALGQGLFISTLAKNQFIASQMALMSAFLPAFILSGFIFEINSMPVAIRALTYLVAARYFVTGLQTLFLTGNVWLLLLKCMLAMAMIGSIFFVIIAYNTRKRLD